MRPKGEFQENREALEDVLEIDLDSALLDHYPEEDWPIVLKSLEEAATKKAAIDRVRIEELTIQNEELSQLLSGYQEKDRKRREFARRQRAASRGN